MSIVIRDKSFFFSGEKSIDGVRLKFVDFLHCSLSICLSVHPSVCLSVCTLVHAYASLCSCMFVYMPHWLALADLELDAMFPFLPSEFQNYRCAPPYSASFVFLSSWGSCCRGKGKHFRTKLYLSLLFIHLHVLSLLLLKEEKKLAFLAPRESSTHTSLSLNPFLKQQHFFQQTFLCEHQSIKCGLFL